MKAKLEDGKEETYNFYNFTDRDMSYSFMTKMWKNATDRSDTESEPEIEDNANVASEVGSGIGENLERMSSDNPYV